MNNLKNTTELVKHILETVPETRNSDQLLYYRVCEELNSNALSGFFGEVILNLKDYKLPPFESVRRARQKVQAAYPELDAKPKIKEIRSEHEKKYRSYAKNSSA